MASNHDRRDEPQHHVSSLDQGIRASQNGKLLHTSDLARRVTAPREAKRVDVLLEQVEVAKRQYGENRGWRESLAVEH